MVEKTEDSIRDIAKIKLGFDKEEKDINQGTGQLTTFNQLGFICNKRKPDGWYLPKDISLPAIILEAKANKINIFDKKWEEELFNNIDVVNDFDEFNNLSDIVIVNRMDDKVKKLI